MPLLACGINHKTAPIVVREKIVFVPEQLTESLHDLVGQAGAFEAAILSTCNRTELYCDSDNNKLLLDWLLNRFELSQAELEPYLYFYDNRAAVRHMMRVASGLDSMILGEPQILGQLKTAYWHADQAGTLGKQLGRLFQHVFSVTKRIRTDTAIGENSLSIASTAVSLAKRIFADLSKKTVLLIGAGETTALVGKYLYESPVKKIIVANRTRERAEILAKQFKGQTITIGELPDYLPQADIVITATASQLPIVGKGLVERCLKQRKHRPMFMVDLAVPRDIEVEVSEMDDVYLYCVDDLQSVIQQGFAEREDAAVQAEIIIDLEADSFMRWLRSLDSVSTVQAFRGQAEEMRDLVLAKARSQLEHGASADDVVQFIAHTLTNKLIHMPTVRIRETSAEGDEALLACIRKLFDLE